MEPLNLEGTGLRLRLRAGVGPGFQPSAFSLQPFGRGHLAVFLILLLGVPRVVAASDSDLYLASVSAASSALRLHETSEARRWLERAPAGLRNWEWHYLDRLADRSLKAIPAHAGPVTSVQFSPNGNLLATTSSDKTVRLWDGRTGEPVATLSGHQATTWRTAFRPDGNGTEPVTTA